MKTSEIAEMIASFLDGQDIVEPLEGELVAIVGCCGRMVLTIHESPGKWSTYVLTVQRYES